MSDSTARHLPEADPTMSSEAAESALGVPPPASVELDRSAERNKRFVWSIVTALLTRPLSLVISLVTVPLFLKYLGSERYGLFMSVGAAAMWLGMTNVGMSLGLVNKLADCYVSDDKNLARRYISTLMLALPALVIVALVILTIVTPLIPWGKVFPTTTPMERETAWAFWWAGALTLAGVIVGNTNGIYSGYQEIVRNNIWDAVAKIVTLVACFAVVWTNWGISGAILATVGAATLVRAINLFGIFAYEKPFLRPARSAFDLSLLRALLIEGVLLLALQMSAIALFQTDTLIIGMVLGPAQVTEFAVVGRLFLTAYGLFVLLIGPLWPTAAEAIRRGDIAWVKSTLRRSLMISTFGMLAVGIAMYVWGSWIVNTWTRGEQPQISRPLVIGLTVTFIARSWTEVQSSVLNAASVLAPQMWVLIANSVLNIIAAVVLCKWFGVVGAAWSIPISTMLTSGWVYPLLIRRRIYSRVKSA